MSFRGSWCLVLLVVSSITCKADRLSSRVRGQALRLEHPSESTADFQKSLGLQQAYFSTSGHTPALHTAVQASRGIVIPAGGRKLLTNAFVVAKVIRDALNSTLPIEVFYDGAEEVDTAIFAKLKEISHVELRDASQLPRPEYLSPWPKALHGYAKKIFSLYSTGFTQVLLLDSDNQPLIKPELLFELPTFSQHGAVFWPDYWQANTALEAPKDGAYSILGLGEPWEGDSSWACTESGQVLFDKQRHMDVLDWVMWLNIWSDVMYKYVLGDKDTFEMAFMLSHKHPQFYRTPIPPRTALTRKIRGPEVLLHVGMVQSADGIPAFLHRTSGGKFDLSKRPERQLRPMYLTEPMSVQAAKQFLWDSGMAINHLPTESVLTLSPQCKDLSQATLGAVKHAVKTQKIRHDLRSHARRLARCGTHHEDETKIPIPMLPFAIFGLNMMQAISYSYVAFAELRRAVLEHGH